MKGALWLGVILAFLMGLAGPAAYMLAAYNLPKIDSQLQLYALLKHRIEGERIAEQAGQAHKAMPIPFEPPKFESLPKELVAVYLSQQGCPGYFSGFKERGPMWLRRQLASLFGRTLPGNGECERAMSRRIATWIYPRGLLEATVATDKIHGVLTPDGLIAYDLATHRFEAGVIGVEAASQKLFGRGTDMLMLHQLTELALTLPPYEFYDHIRSCKNAALIRRARDHLLQGLQTAALLPRHQVEVALEKPVSCDAESK